MSFLSLRGANIASSLKFSFLAAPFLYHFPQRKEYNRVYTRENKGSSDLPNKKGNGRAPSIQLGGKWQASIIPCAETPHLRLVNNRIYHSFFLSHFKKII